MLLAGRGAQVVAVTGAGTGDAPFLKEAHVGLSMAISGTAVAWVRPCLACERSACVALCWSGVGKDEGELRVIA